ncbi:MAG: bifunctional UDP-N-acetylmuramoyl-tripeptide:D-alanyl-D-alanine ligase/alanine racemase [Bacteroidota bacterium]
MLSFSELPDIVGGKIIQYVEERPISHLSLDSRALLTAGSGSLFFAIQGQRHDGHQFLPAVYAQGIRQFVVERNDLSTYQALTYANIIQVANSTEALQRLATYHRSRYRLPLLAITGSNGKTIVKEWLSQILALKYVVAKSPQSYNSQIGVPCSVWLIDDTHQYGIFEAGISQPGEMTKLARILQPTAGIFTNIGSAHDEGFATLQQKIEEKALLFSNCQNIYYCKDHTPIHRVLTTLYRNKVNLIAWSMLDKAADYHIQERSSSTDKQTVLTVATRNRRYTFILPFQDKASVENAIHCIVFLLHEDFCCDTIQTALTKLKAIPMRMTLKKGINDCQIIDDTYNNDLVGLRVALDFMTQQKQAAYSRTVVLSDLLQTGIAPQKLYTQIAQLLKNKQVDRIIGIGKALATYAETFAAFEAHFYDHTEALLKEDIQNKFRNELILVKGARSFGLERLVDRLQQKIHTTVLEVDLDAITHNLNFFRSKLGAGTQLMAVVKALAYGSSSFEIAQLLQYHRVDYLAVAYADEGVLLREHGITLPIMVMNPTPESFDKLLVYDLAPEVYSLKLLHALHDFTASERKSLDIHLKLETGMHRLGFAESDLSTLVQVLRTTSTLRVVGIMSHLAASEAPQHDAYTKYQFTLFTKLATYIEQALGIHTVKHLLNSSGILRFPDYQLDMVRVGIGLYGVGVGEEMQQYLEVATTLKTTISQIKHIPQGATVGYGRRGLAKKNLRLATLAIGYADGFSRALGNGRGSVWINGHLAPVVGDVCMDMSMVDVTNIPATEGDEVTIFGKALPIAQVAASMGTISYEVLTNVSERVKRIYYSR